MAIEIHVDSLDDPRILPYRNLKDRDIARMDDRFIAESEQVVRRLLASAYEVDSVFVAARRAAEIVPLVPGQVPVYVLPDPLVEKVVGFKFHSGVLACGRRGRRRSLDEVMNQLGTRATIVVCPEIANTENLGGLMRIAAGFGADAMILGPQSCDPFYRQAIRVSMGTVFSLNLFRSDDLLSDLRRLKQQWGVELLATVLDDDAEPLDRASRSGRIALLFGNEAQGLGGELLQFCDRRITIPMHLGTDSLNVAIAAAVVLYHFGRK